jgi:beta-lactamase class A
MHLDRRSLLASLCWMATVPAFAADAPPELDSYERESGGRIGVYAENLATGKKLTWRADERFVMCSTFKASLAACVLARVDRGEDQLAAMISYGRADLLEYAPVAGPARGGVRANRTHGGRTTGVSRSALTCWPLPGQDRS